MSALRKIMNDEIKKYQGRIYYLEERFDSYGNRKAPSIEPADWINDTSCYDHCTFELHHMIKFTYFEQNKKWFNERGINNCLILIRRTMHVHLENPVHGLSNEEFFNLYKINKYELLFDKKNYFKGNYPKVLTKPTISEIEYDGCFDCLDTTSQTAERAI